MTRKDGCLVIMRSLAPCLSGPLIVTKRFQLDKNCTFRMENHILSTFIALLFLVEGFRYISCAKPKDTVICDGYQTSMSPSMRGKALFQHNRWRKNQKPGAPSMEYNCDLEKEAGSLAESSCKTKSKYPALGNNTNIAKRPSAEERDVSAAIDRWWKKGDPTSVHVQMTDENVKKVGCAFYLCDTNKKKYMFVCKYE
ncbi:hypothetical protein KIN20_019892 [Parelaphostrongylus tenuis]|uniref:SCP domain-containing protein n=1 Tax=Parelaphostrongylus tenuis TaxID=148309 RepID=A0AAD5N5D6_PARTN|nr:hypothetical protein KIN20_019892 [Parelaphostrongylus tenuis]